uniref:Pre-mRNA-splicing factor SPF27 n=1 Tax=Eptatretus burgeri TaxID=7764 RepID=A0A8C4WZ23_EPTBU
MAVPALPDAPADALPYFDSGYDAPGVRQAAAALVEEETRRYRPTKNYLSYLTSVDYMAFQTEVMRVEFERVAARQPMDLLSMKRYELPQPPPGQRLDVAAWLESVSNASAQLEHQAARIDNLELLAAHGPAAWRAGNADWLAKCPLSVSLRKAIQDLNFERKTEQLATGAKLQQLEETWVTLVSKNYELETVIARLETELAAQRSEKQNSSP